ncbi:hypothetical protein DPMN_041266 [Dreissena polymorpha]|uniref:Uncharacterized protein n=1 Tax=Dreissena polymorpha TaxID=45954 RepID=A0A9D4CYH0_DREPO|nr:hypothetical protein DPMN_041266 [Dreissena polymorpha]
MGKSILRNNDDEAKHNKYKNKINKSGRFLLDWIRLATVFSLRCSFTVTDATSLTVAPYIAHVGAHPM